MNRFFRQYPAIGVGIISGLVSLVGALLATMLSLGYGHTMRRFDEIAEDSKQNVEEHRALEGRMIRVETLIVNGHGEDG